MEKTRGKGSTRKQTKYRVGWPLFVPTPSLLPPAAFGHTPKITFPTLRVNPDAIKPEREK